MREGGCTARRDASMEPPDIRGSAASRVPLSAFDTEHALEREISAIGEQVRPGHEGGIVGGEEQGRCRDLVHMSGAVEQMPWTADPVLRLARAEAAAAARGADDARREGVDADVVGRMVARE